MIYDGIEVTKALTIRQPYAWAIMEQYKTFEFRSWPPHDDVDYFVVHAGAKLDKSGYQKMAQYFINPDGHTWIPGQADLVFGAGLCVVRIRGLFQPGEFLAGDVIDLYTEAIGYQPDTFVWEIEVVHRFPEPIPARGQLGLWTWQPEAKTS